MKEAYYKACRVRFYIHTCTNLKGKDWKDFIFGSVYWMVLLLVA